MKKVLMINGSPHSCGCTFTALKEIEKELKAFDIESEILHIGIAPVHGCIECNACKSLNRCIYQDDICNELVEKMEASDGIIIGSPVYYGAPNGALMALLNRAFHFASDRFRSKPSAAVVSCRRGGASSAFDCLNKYFTINQMPVISSRYWNAIHGTTPEEVLKDLEGLQIMRALARNMAWFLKGADPYNLPVMEEKIRTNFI